MLDPSMPPTLADAIATEPLWLKVWVTFLGVVQVVGVVFVAHREHGRWRLRPEPFVVLASLAAAAAFMEWLYAQVGYVRLLGLGHLVCWTPVYVWMLSRRRDLVGGTWFGRWVIAYLVVVGLSLAIDLIDVVRHLLGDGELLYRWGRP